MKTFYVGVKGVFEKDQKVLLLKKRAKDGSIFWDMPGGRMDEGEEITETLQRELKEELGFTTITIGKLLSAHNLENYHTDNNGLMMLFYEAFSDHFEIQLSEEHIAYEWLNHDDVSKKIEAGERINNGIRSILKIVTSKNSL